MVARFAGGEEVAGSNPVVPTIQKNGAILVMVPFFFIDLTPATMSDSEAQAAAVEKLRVLISERLLPLPDGFPSDGDLYQQGLDSMALMQLILVLEQELGVHIEPQDLAKEHFKTLQAIAKLVETKRNGGE